MVGLGLVLRSLWRGRGLYSLWIGSVCIAVAGLVVVDVYRASLAETLRLQGRNILAADLAVSVRRSLTDEEVGRVAALLGPGAVTSRSTEMLAMVSGSKSSHLAQLHFIEDNYPLAGELRIDGERTADSPQVWASADFLVLTGLKLGDPVKIGQVELKITGTVAKDSTQTMRFGSMVPRIYLNRKFLTASGLVQTGSTLTDSYRALLPLPDRNLKKMVEAVFPDPAITVSTPDDLQQGSLRVLGRLLDFLGLVGLVGLSLGWVGIYFLAQRWLQGELVSLGILKAQGLSERWLNFYLRGKLGLILSLGAVFGGIVAWIAATLLFPLIRDSLPAEFVLTWSWTSTLILLLIGPGSGLLLLYESTRRSVTGSPLDLIRGRLSSPVSLFSVILTMVAASLLFILLTFLEARSWKVTFIFLGCLIGAIILMTFIGYLFLRAMAGITKTRQGWLTHLTASLWLRRQGMSLLLIVISGMAGLLAQLIPNLEQTLLRELKAPSMAERPALFMFDIQDDQVDPLEKYLIEQGITVSQRAPFIRSRIIKVNDTAYERAKPAEWATREEETDARSRNRGVNLSYRKELSPYEHILTGKKWNEMNSTLSEAEISVEDAYAGRIGLKLGDLIEFEIDGIPVKAKVASIRRVDWNSFEPAFFMIFPEGVLNEAPKTWIMTVKTSDKMTPVEIQTLVAGRFPNVTSVNVQNTLISITELFGKLSAGLKVAGWLSLTLGLFVYLIVLFFQLVSAERDWIQLRVLGLKTRQLLALQLYAYGGLCLAGSMLGAGLSVVMTWILARYVFSTSAGLNWSGILLVLLFTLASVAATITVLIYRQRGAIRARQ